MRILHASSELHPYSKTGGLADMVASLTKSLAGAGHEISVVTPLYRGIRERFPGIRKFDWHMELPLGAQNVSASVWLAEPQPRLRIYFIDQPEFFQRASLYQENGADFPDNAERFIFLSKAALHLARYLPSPPEIVHVHDWQTALVPALIRHQKFQEGWGSAPGTCLTIHNLAYQGSFPRAVFKATNLPPEYFLPAGAEFYGRLNCLKAGICFANVLTTVSPRYAREITTPEYGCALDDVLRQRRDRLVGILNGVDYEEWNTIHNPHLRHAFSLRSLKGKTANKLELQKELGLRVAADIPLFANITRLAEQKGVDIQLGALEEMLAANLQFALLGSGSTTFERGYQKLGRRFPGRVGIQIGFDPALAHRLEAGADFFLMPSRFEPCGLNQMYSLRYGTIPIVRVTGGLDDSVIDLNENIGRANGIKFAEYSSRALAKGMRKALALYDEPALLRQYRQNGMKADFSWERTTAQYEEAYRRASGLAEVIS